MNAAKFIKELKARIKSLENENKMLKQINEELKKRAEKLEKIKKVIWEKSVENIGDWYKVVYRFTNINNDRMLFDHAMKDIYNEVERGSYFIARDGIMLDKIDDNTYTLTLYMTVYVYKNKLNDLEEEINILLK